MADDLRRRAEALVRAIEEWKALDMGSRERGEAGIRLGAAEDDFAEAIGIDETFARNLLALYAQLDAQAARIAALEGTGKVVVDTWGRFDDPHTRCTEDPCLFCLTVVALARALEGTA